MNAARDGATSQSVSVVTDAPIPRLFDFLTKPANHVLLDGSGTLLSAAEGRITGEGDVFTITMSAPARGAYDVENHVLAFVPDVQISWTPANPGEPPRGVRWDWQFDVGPRGETVITQTYDWSAVTDHAWLTRHQLPQVSAEEMRQSIKRLIDLVSSYA